MKKPLKREKRIKRCWGLAKRMEHPRNIKNKKRNKD